MIREDRDKRRILRATQALQRCQGLHKLFVAMELFAILLLALLMGQP
jgi:hypothetical protein